MNINKLDDIITATTPRIRNKNKIKETFNTFDTKIPIYLDLNINLKTPDISHMISSQPYLTYF